jgi:hypothetical protein
MLLQTIMAVRYIANVVRSQRNRLIKIKLILRHHPINNGKLMDGNSAHVW